MLQPNPYVLQTLRLQFPRSNSHGHCCWLAHGEFVCRNSLYPSRHHSIYSFQAYPSYLTITLLFRQALRIWNNERRRKTIEKTKLRTKNVFTSKFKDYYDFLSQLVIVFHILLLFFVAEENSCACIIRILVWWVRTKGSEKWYIKICIYLFSLEENDHKNRSVFIYFLFSENKNL